MDARCLCPADGYSRGTADPLALFRQDGNFSADDGQDRARRRRRRLRGCARAFPRYASTGYCPTGGRRMKPDMQQVVGDGRIVRLAEFERPRIRFFLNGIACEALADDTVLTAMLLSAPALRRSG